MIKIVTIPPPNWDKLAAAFKVKWEGDLVVTYAGVIHCPSGRIATDVLVHELVHVEQQSGKDMEEMLERYTNDVKYVKEVETPALRAQAAFIDATLPEAEAWCKKYAIAKRVAEMYRGAFTMETASAIMGI